MNDCKSAFKSLAAVAVAGLLSGAPEVLASDEIRMGSRMEYYDVVYRAGGFDEKYGLKAVGVSFGTGVDVIRALQSGDIDVASSGHVPMTVLLSRSQDVIVVGTGAYNTGSVYRMVVPVNSDTQSLEDLKGKTIATRVGSGAYNAFHSYLQSQGLDEADFNVNDAGPAAIVAGMESGTVDAAIWFEPTISLVLHRGWGRVLLDFSDHATFQVHWLANRKFAEDNPDTLVRFLAGAMDAQELLDTDPKKAAELIASAYQERGLDYPPEVFELGIPLMTWDTRIEPHHLEEIKRTYQALKARDRVRGEEPDWDRLITTQYLEQAQDQRK